MSTHALTVAVLATLLLTFMALLVAAVTCVEPGAWERYAHGWAYHRHDVPAGHVTAVPGISRNAMLRILGNGVVPQQTAAALTLLLADMEVAA